MVVDHCTDGADRRACNRRRGRRRGPRRWLHTRRRLHQRKPSVCKGKATFRNYAVHTRCTQHATYDPRGPTRRQGLAPKSLHRSLMVTSGAGRHSGPAMRRAARNPPVSPPNPAAAPSRWHTPGRHHPPRMAIRRTRCLAARRLSANNGVTPKVPSSAPADGAMSEIQQWRRDRALGSGAAPLVRRREALAPTRRGAPTRRASRGDKRRKSPGGAFCRRQLC